MMFLVFLKIKLGKDSYFKGFSYVLDYSMLK